MYGETYPLSNWRPSVNSSSMPKLSDGSTVMTPSLPTRSIASAMMPPISGSLLAEMAAIWASSALLSTGREAPASCSTSCLTALSMPRFSSTGLPPSATRRMPSLTTAWASTVAVVVPSPATSLGLFATSFNSCAPMFSNGFGSWISRAIVTPSLVIVGGPVSFSSTALRPIGPRVTRTALASLSTPATRRRRASSLNLSSFAICAPIRLGGPSIDRLEVEPEVLGAVFGVGEQQNVIVEHHHAAVVRRHDLLEVVRGELEPHSLRDLLHVKVDLADAIHADH